MLRHDAGCPAAKADTLDGGDERGSEQQPYAGEGGHWLCTLRSAVRPEAGQRQTAPWLRRGERPRDRGGFRWRHLARRVHGRNRRRNLRARFLSEEGEERHQDTEAHHRPDQKAPARCNRSGEAKEAMTKVQPKRGHRRAADRVTTKITKSTGNVFADIAVPNPEEHLLKAELVRRIPAPMEERNLNQTSA